MTELSLAESITSEVIEELKTAENENQYFDEFVLLHAKILIRLNKTSEAVELLQKFARDSFRKQQDDENAGLNEEKYRRAADLLQEDKKKPEANMILEELYGQQLSLGSNRFIALYWSCRNSPGSKQSRRGAAFIESNDLWIT